MSKRHVTMLAQLRKATGKSQAQIASELGVSKAAYSSWETGRSNLGVERLVALSDCLGCTPNDIIGYKDTDMRFATITRDEEEHLNLWRMLAPNVRAGLTEILRATTKGWRA